jgi:hypothetical protein
MSTAPLFRIPETTVEWRTRNTDFSEVNSSAAGASKNAGERVRGNPRDEHEAQVNLRLIAIGQLVISKRSLLK